MMSREKAPWLFVFLCVAPIGFVNVSFAQSVETAAQKLDRYAPNSSHKSVISFCATSRSVSQADTKLFASDNLVAWCIVPFDAKKRNPQQRSEMLNRLGFEKVAYDWRDEHVATFEEEIIQYQKHGLEYFAFWSWHPTMEPLIRKYDIHPQLWQINPSPTVETQEAKVTAAVAEMLPLVEKGKELNCKVGLYNHGGWGGEPENLVAVCKELREKHGMEHVGIVYNFHHGHDRIADFADSLKLMLPYLLIVNINGMNDGANPKIMPVGDGQHERKMLATLIESGYDGPIGILDHREELDAEESLRLNLDGLKKVVVEMEKALGKSR
jgi:sugar phosphate isomerase/epimerase